MYGAILGDMIGSPYEFGRGDKTKDFPLFDTGAGFTDDSVMTVAVADALMEAQKQDSLADEQIVKDLLIDAMHKWGRLYPNAGYGGRFYQWLMTGSRQAYNSFGNGSGMRVSPAGWLSADLEEARRLARWSAEVTHNHPEGIKGAEAIASAVFLARTGHPKDTIREYVSEAFGYDLARTCDEIRPTYSFDVTCQGSVPEAIIAFLDGSDFEGVIRTAVSLGGDTDTIGAMAGSIAEAYYGVPDNLKQECENRLSKDMLDVLVSMQNQYLNSANMHSIR